MTSLLGREPIRCVKSLDMLMIRTREWSSGYHDAKSVYLPSTNGKESKVIDSHARLGPCQKRRIARSSFFCCPSSPSFIFIPLLFELCPLLSRSWLPLLYFDLLLHPPSRLNSVRLFTRRFKEPPRFGGLIIPAPLVPRSFSSSYRAIQDYVPTTYLTCRPSTTLQS